MDPKTKRELEEAARTLEGMATRADVCAKRYTTQGKPVLAAGWAGAAEYHRGEAARLRALLPTLPEEEGERAWAPPRYNERGELV